jgi:hypothetical protein
MSRELSAAGIINQVNEIKTRVSGLDKQGRVFYEIWGFNPVSSSEFQLFGKGNNRKEACYPHFENELNAVLSSPTIVHIKIHLKDGRKDLGSSEIVIKPAYPTNTPTLLPIAVEKPDNTQPQAAAAQPQNGFGNVNFIQMLGQAFLGVTGLSGVNDEMSGLGTIMAIQEKVIGDKYEKQRQEDRLQGIIEKNAVLKSDNEKLQTEINKLNGEIDDNEDRIDELEKQVAEYEKLNPKLDMISCLAGQVAQSALLGIISKTKYAGLLGLDETAPAAPSQPSQPSQPVIIEAVDDSPRGKAKQQITAWIDTLGDSDFSALYQLLTLFAKGTPITSCLQWATGNTEAQTPAPVLFGDDDNDNDND